MDVMGAVGLNEIGKAAGAADAGYSGDLLMPHLALLNQLEVKRKDREITTTGTPCGVIGRDFLLGQTFAVSRQSGRSRRGRSRSGRRGGGGGAVWGSNFSYRSTHFCLMISQVQLTVCAFRR